MKKIFLGMWQFIISKLKTLGNEADKKEVIKRIKDLQESDDAPFGVMTAQEILAHLADPIRIALGEKTAEHQPVMYQIFSFPVIKQLTSQWLPWPPGIPRAPELIPFDGIKGKGTPVGSFNDDKVKLLNLIEKISSISDLSTPNEHMVFGELSGKEWKRLMWRHINVHLKQFNR